MTSSETLTNLDQSDPVPLDPIILSARDELLEKYSDKSFEEQITFYKAVIEGEKDSLSRLSAMAARVYILRKRLALLAGNVMEDQLDELSEKATSKDIKEHPRIPIIMKHNAFVKETFLKVKTNVDAMVVGKQVA